MDIGISLVVTFVLVLVNGYFSMSEMALVNAKRLVLQKEADEGDKHAARALELASDSNSFLATIQVAITLV
ncbi:MAG: CNNM domain-containing protein, partial [Raoultibacter sp.]